MRVKDFCKTTQKHKLESLVCNVKTEIKATKTRRNRREGKNKERSNK